MNILPLAAATSLAVWPMLAPAKAGCSSIEPELIVLADVQASLIAAAHPETCSVVLSIVPSAPKGPADSFKVVVTQPPSRGQVTTQGGFLNYRRTLKDSASDVIAVQLSREGEPAPQGASVVIRTQP